MAGIIPLSKKLESDVVNVFSTNTAFAALKADGSVHTWGDKSNVATAPKSGISSKVTYWI